MEDNLLKELKGNKISNNKAQSQYKIERILGNGSFGVVYEAIFIETGERVAIKKVFQDKRYKNRELAIIRLLNHPNVIILKQAYYTTEENEDDIYLNIVMDFIPDTLAKIIKQFRVQKEIMPKIICKVFGYQMFRAIAYLHAIGICHRDIKPQNVLIDMNNYVLKICDFGSAKKLSKDEPNIPYICSRYYRAPELIFGASQYTVLIDVWSTGCVFAEMFLNRPIFPGESSIDQLVEIMKILGTPTLDDINNMNENFSQYKFPQVFKPKIDQQAIDLIKKTLVYSPNKRLTALQCLKHPYFDELREKDTNINGQKLPDLFNFSQEEINSDPELIQQLIPSWYKEQKNKKN